MTVPDVVTGDDRRASVTGVRVAPAARGGDPRGRTGRHPGRSIVTAVTVREATADELASVLGILDGAALETDAGRVRTRIERGDVLVAVPDESRTRSGAAGTGRETPVGALVLDGDEVANVAVRRRRRGQGVGTTLVEAAATRRDHLVAEFDADAKPFYESLEFTVETVSEERYRGRLER